MVESSAIQFDLIEINNMHAYLTTSFDIYAIGFYFLRVQTQTFPNWSLKPSSRVIIGLNREKPGFFPPDPWSFGKTREFPPRHGETQGLRSDPRNFQGLEGKGIYTRKIAL